MQNEKEIKIWERIDTYIISTIFTIAIAAAIISMSISRTIYIFVMTAELLTSIPRQDVKTPVAGDIGQ